MFPHIVTIYNIVESVDGVSYHKCVVSDVFHYETQEIIKEEHGEKINSIYNVIFSEKSLAKYIDKILIDSTPDVFSLNYNDIVVYGEFGEIEDISDIQKAGVDYFLIKSKQDNRYGSNNLKNILVSG